KRALPNYGVFDDKRYFSVGSEAVVFDVEGLPVGLAICEDIWTPGPVADAAARHARLILTLNASPYCIGKRERREEVARQRARENDVSLISVNLVGGQDEVVFDGHSFAVNKAGEVVERLAGFREQLAILKLSTSPGQRGRIVGRSSVRRGSGKHAEKETGK